MSGRTGAATLAEAGLVSDTLAGALLAVLNASTADGPSAGAARLSDLATVVGAVTGRFGAAAATASGLADAALSGPDTLATPTRDGGAAEFGDAGAARPDDEDAAVAFISVPFSRLQKPSMRHGRNADPPPHGGPHGHRAGNGDATLNRFTTTAPTL